MKYFNLFIIFFLLTSGAYAQWSTDPNENTRVTHGGLLPQIVTDGSGGAFIVYQDSPAFLRQLWVQRLDRFGYVRFAEKGIRISSADRYQSPYCYPVSDGADGVIVLFDDRHLVGDPFDEVAFCAVYAQRIDSSGAKLWGEIGIELSPFVEGEGKAGVSVCSDGEHGAFVFWGEDRDKNGAFELRAQRITANGQSTWADRGLVVTDKFIFENASNPSRSVTGGAGNAIVFYSDSSETNLDTRLQKLNSEGRLLWGERGAAIYPNYPTRRQMISDNRGGAILSGVRREFDGVSAKYIIRAQRVDGSGQALWGEKGVTVTDKADNQTLEIELATDKRGNSIIVWRDRRTGRFEEYAQRMNPDGIPLWESDGIALSEFDSQKSLLGSGIAADPNAKYIFIWHDLRIENGCLFGQKLDSTGSKLWSKDDIPISTRVHFQRSHMVISDNSGGAIACWYEIGTGSGWGIFAQQVSRNGNLGDVLTTCVSQQNNSFLPSQYVLHLSYPNPFNSETVINYELPKSSHVTLRIYDITGKELITLIDQNQLPGVYQIKWNGIDWKGAAVSSGIYIYQLCAGSFVRSEKTIFIK